MKKHHVLYENGDRRWTVLHNDPEKPADILDSNEYLISNGDRHMLLDPGGFAIFPSVLSALVQITDPAKVEKVFASHQDPDIASSFSLWQKINPDIKCHISWLWESFVPHFGGQADHFLPIPDEGMIIELGNYTFEAIPAHHCHSAGNFHLYDPLSKIYFSGDVGAAMRPDDKRTLFVEDFDKHLPYIEQFHRRWFGSNEHKNNWCERALEMDIEVLCPQHGSIYVGPAVKQFLTWFRNLNVGATSNNRVKQ